MKLFITLILIFLASLSFSQEIKITYEEFGKTERFVFSDNDSKDFEVLYFFSYSCPACYDFKDVVSQWKEFNIDNSKNIDFRKVPVIFQDHWLFTSKAFFIANGLKLDIDDAIYTYFHEKNKFIVDDETLIEFFQNEFNIERSNLMSFLKSPSLIKATTQSMKIADNFEIMGTPSFVIIDKEKNVYKVNKSVVNSKLELISTLTYLVKPELRKILTGEK